jgi:hypothetical protein
MAVDARASHSGTRNPVYAAVLELKFWMVTSGRNAMSMVDAAEKGWTIPVVASAELGQQLGFINSHRQSPKPAFVISVKPKL